MKQILVVDDEADIRELVAEILDDEGYRVATAGDAAQAREQIAGQRFDLALLDIWMPDLDGISLLREWREHSQGPDQVVMMSGHATVETAVEATRLGAYDFIEKPISLAKLLLAVDRALQAGELVAENQGLRQRLAPPGEPVGRSNAMRELREQLQRLAAHDTWVLLTGEAGVGKEMAARYLHGHSGRRQGEFVAFNPDSIAESNMMAELFGSQEGDGLYRGRLERADAGTLFIDDVLELPLAAQQRLAGALESRRFLRLGGNEEVSVSLRVVAGSAGDLQAAMAEGKFDEALFYQLNVVPLHLPPLRDRREDVLDLLNYYVDYYTGRDQLPPRRFSLAAQNRLRNHHWPGNARELANLVQRLLVLAAEEEISEKEVDNALAQMVRQQSRGQASSTTSAAFDLPLREAREQFERDYLAYQLRRVGGRVGELAKVSGMERTHLYRKLRALGLDPKAAGAGDGT
jgi:DNA-binding NtrC family response regulator